ncbi:MAG: N-acetyl sugar amidotransferase [Candidatus Omnitrophica bacterium]|nr:N-acetyl sugar amidotransferase [Candidatus Omnitrophota bacterium]
MPSTRPWINHNEHGACNACENAEAKKRNIDWKARWKELEKICDKYRSKGDTFDCIVPCSGGKDGSIVAWKLKHEMGMHPLCITLAPQLPTKIGIENLHNFINSGFDHLLITPNPQNEKKIALFGMTEQGRPRLSTVLGQTTALVNAAVKFKIPLIVYGEEGHSEYGGVTHMGTKSHFTKEERIQLYFSGNDPDKIAEKIGIKRKDLPWMRFPTLQELQSVGILWLHWSYFEKWNQYEHYLLAKRHCEFKTLPQRSIGTYTNFAQLDDDMQDLHVYFMFLKFGFGRTTSDACIDVRRGALDRKQALALVRRYDGEYPESLIPHFLDYFSMTKEQFDSIIDKWANREVLTKVNGIWKLKELPS